MPKRQDIKKILIIGSGPIIISQACEFDYSGTQACKALKQEGFELVLVNSNPATIMTDPELADRTYIEPVTPEMVAMIIEREKPDALLPTLGGQTGLNVAVQVAEAGVLKKHGVEMIGARLEAIKKAEDRDLFIKAMEAAGVDVARSGYAHGLEEAREIAKQIGFPVVIRPSFTLGGTGGGVAYNVEEFDEIAASGLELSLTHQILVEESLIGWKEFELEVMRDKKDNVVIVCSIENFDPMGVHTGDSITVAPIQTLTDREYQKMRDAAIAIIREIGVETGGSNIQFAMDPENGRMLAIEMNPRVSRSSALASKATGFPIAKIAAKLAVGYTLDEIPNDITKRTPACFEPAIDYCVVKIPRWAFEKFPGVNETLTTQMKSVGETMSIGRTFKEALQKGIRSLEIGRYGIGADIGRSDILPDADTIERKLRTPNASRLFYIRHAYRSRMSTEQIYGMTGIDPWFLENIKEIIEMEEELRGNGAAHSRIEDVPARVLEEAKKTGFSDRQLAYMWKADEKAVRRARLAKGVRPVFKLVDTCSAEFEAYTPYYYSTYEKENEARVSDRKKIMILGGGPNRIGQGIEFDYCCVHASMALKEAGYETIMVNSNPETVSTDYDTSDKLYFEPLTHEDVMNIVDEEKPDGVIVQFGGQTPLNLAAGLQEAGVKIIGTSVESIDRAEDRKKFQELIERLGLRQPPNGTARNIGEAAEAARRIGYPVLVRPSYVLGGRAMEIVYDETTLKEYVDVAVEVSGDHPVLIDKFLEDAIEVDVDMVADGKTGVIGGIMEHVEEAGIHSGDSACAIPAYSLKTGIQNEIRKATAALAAELHVVGLMNVQYAVRNGIVYVLEVNPRASRTVPFVSKAIGVALAKLAAKTMVGFTLEDMGFTKEVRPPHFSVKVPVFPFSRFQGVDTVLGPEMKSTGEVMGVDADYGVAFMKGQLGAGQKIPLEGNIFVSVNDRDKPVIATIARKFTGLGFKLVSTPGTAEVLKKNGIDATVVQKIAAGGPNVLDLVKSNEVKLIINTPTGKGPKLDEAKIRSLAAVKGIPCITTISAAWSVVRGIAAFKSKKVGVKSIQEYHARDS